MSNTQAQLVEVASKQPTEVLVWSLDVADSRRDALLKMWRETGDYDLTPEIQAHSATCNAITEVLVSRHKEIDDAIDVWCEDLNPEDQRTMARFIVDFVAAFPAVIA